ncbi:hypothetical protein Tco_1334349, partial [Tanacetum coccineum]
TSDVPTCDDNRVNVESDLVESLINRDTLIVYTSKIDPILDEFAGELAHIAPIPLGIVEADPDDDTNSDKPCVAKAYGRKEMLFCDRFCDDFVTLLRLYLLMGKLVYGDNTAGGLFHHVPLIVWSWFLLSSSWFLDGSYLLRRLCGSNWSLMDSSACLSPILVYTSSDDDYFEDVEYVSFEEVNDVEQEEKEFDLEDILQIQDVILREKLLKISRLISNIESLKDNPNPIPVTDSDSSDTSLSFSNNSLPEFESFSDHTEETRSGSTTTHANYSLPEYESFHFDNPSFPRPPSEPPDVEILEPEINNFDVLNNDESFDPREGENVVFLNVEEDDSFTFTIRTFLPFVTYPEASPLSCSTGSEDTIFDPSIITFPFSYLDPVAFSMEVSCSKCCFP